jgi:hypothetical protein
MATNIDSDDGDEFTGFIDEEIESVIERDSDIEVSSVSSVHTSDLSDWSDPEDDQQDDVNDWSENTEMLNIHNFEQTVGVNIDDFDPVNALQKQFFYQLFTEDMFAEIVTQTNIYAQVKIASKPQGDNMWYNVTIEEIKAYFGMLILMGNVLPREEMYWASDDRLGVQGINKIMSLKRYKKLVNIYI